MKLLLIITVAIWGIAAFAQSPATSTEDKPKTETSEDVSKPAPSTDVSTEESK